MAGFTGAVVVKQAWISDDSLAMARTIANWIRGYGPYFNIGEAAQAFTSPLWFVLSSAVTFVTRDVLMTFLALSVVAVASGAYLLGARLSRWWQAAFLGLLLASSFAITDFATSGLENPLLLLIVVLAWDQARRDHPLGVAAAIGLLVVTRYDMALIAIPLAAHTGIRLWNRRDARALAAAAATAAAPLATWFLFSWVTYGSVFSETASAKLNLLIPRRELLGQGVGYVFDTFQTDWATFGLVMVGLSGVAVGSGFIRSLSVGSLAYVSYVVWIGGDFMVGRFLFVPAVIGLVVLADRIEDVEIGQAPGTIPRTFGSIGTEWIAVGALAVVVFAQAGVHPLTEDPLRSEMRWGSGDPLSQGLADERRVHIEKGYGLWNFILLEPYDNPFSLLRTALREWPAGAQITEIRIQCGELGTESVFYGPGIHYIDPCGKSDPFLARHITFEATGGEWRPGHYRRDVPDGYLEALASGDSTFLAPEYRAAFEAVSAERRIDEAWPDDPSSIVLPEAEGP
jgi:arabinofuranosyltransferase